MKTKLNEELFLWAVGVLQPATAKNVIDLIVEMFPEIRPLPTVSEVESRFNTWRESGLLARVHGKSRYYSLTYEGQSHLSVPLRRYKDQVRLFLLKDARNAKVTLSGEATQELAGVSPAVDGSTDLQEGGRPVIPAVDPRGPRITGRNYWPPISKQHNFRAGSGSSSPDIYLDYFSYPSIKSIHSVSRSPATGNDLSAVDISLALGISPRLFTSFTHAPENHYRSFQIGKRGGGTRQIDSPRVFLKTVQCWVVEYFLWRLPSHPSCHSYQKDKSIQTNASPHVGKKFVANVDIENFFGSITTEMVRMLFLRNGMGEQLSKNLSKLLTLRGSLPQGSPASPIISNAFLYEFDEIIYQKAIEDSADYTRYADDMTLSGDNRQELKNMISIIQGELEKLGLRLKDTKTRIASYGGQQRVTGVVVNTRISPPRTLRRQVRAMFHQASLNPADADVRILRGYLSYLSSYSFLKESEELSKYRAILNQVIDSKNQS